MAQPSKGRLKIVNFVRYSNTLEKSNTAIQEQEATPIPRAIENPTWTIKRPIIQCHIPGILKKDTQSDQVRKSVTLEHIHEHYPKEYWTHVYIDGSAEDAVKNGGAGIYIQYSNGEEEKHMATTGANSSNYRAEVEAIRIGADKISNSHHNQERVVFLTDAKSVLQALEGRQDKKLSSLFAKNISFFLESKAYPV